MADNHRDIKTSKWVSSTNTASRSPRRSTPHRKIDPKFTKSSHKHQSATYDSNKQMDSRHTDNHDLNTSQASSTSYHANRRYTEDSIKLPTKQSSASKQPSHASKKLVPGQITNEEMQALDKRYFRLVTHELPLLLKPFLSNPTLFSDIVQEIFQSVNQYVDNKITETMHGLATVLGIGNEDGDRDVLIEILLKYPSHLGRPNGDVAALLHEIVGENVLKGMAKDTKIKPELRPKLLDQWENTEKQSELWRDCMLEIYHLFYTLKFKAVKYKFSLPKCWGHNYKFKGYDEKILVPGSKDTSSQNMSYMVVLPEIAIQDKNLQPVFSIGAFCIPIHVGTIGPVGLSIDEESYGDEDLRHRSRDQRNGRPSIKELTHNKSKSKIEGSRIIRNQTTTSIHKQPSLHISPKRVGSKLNDYQGSQKQFSFDGKSQKSIPKLEKVSRPEEVFGLGRSESALDLIERNILDSQLGDEGSAHAFSANPTLNNEERKTSALEKNSQGLSTQMDNGLPDKMESNDHRKSLGIVYRPEKPPSSLLFELPLREVTIAHGPSRHGATIDYRRHRPRPSDPIVPLLELNNLSTPKSIIPSPKHEDKPTTLESSPVAMSKGQAENSEKIVSYRTQKL